MFFNKGSARPEARGKMELGLFPLERKKKKVRLQHGDLFLRVLMTLKREPGGDILNHSKVFGLHFKCSEKTEFQIVE